MAPDSRYLYLGQQHKQARSYLESSGRLTDGFVVITGEVGSGKTILIDDYLNNTGPDVVAVSIHQTILTPVQFLQCFLTQLGARSFRKGKAELLEIANKILIQTHDLGKRIVLVVDEAQHLSLDVLEEIRLLTCIEKGNQRILSVIFAGQRELRNTVFSPRMEQFSQRVALHCHLGALDRTDTENYIRHRLKIAGDSAEATFAEDTFDLIYRYTGGVPRLINTLCNTALIRAFADGRKVISRDLLSDAVAILDWREKNPERPNVENLTGSSHNDRSVGAIGIQVECQQGESAPAEAEPSDESPAPHEGYRLLVALDSSGVAKHTLKSGQISLGSSPDNEIQIRSRYVSRHHAHLVSTPTATFLRDLNSTNGTFVNTERVRARALRHGDLIVMGKHCFQFVSQALET
jgi:type II secretory pathway predicted ATPase ExeA